MPLNQKAAAQLLQSLRVGSCLSFNLHPVAAPVAKAGVGEALLQAAIAGQQQQSLAIGIEPAGGINLRNRDELRQTTPVTAGFWRELA